MQPTSESTQLLLSVIIATYGRKEILRETLDKLSQQTMPMINFEVILVDDGSDDGTDEMVAELQKSLPYALYYFKQQHLGPGAAHNKGVRKAKADIILFLANDMHATPSVLESHYKSHLKYSEPNIGVVGKLRESPDLNQTVFQRAWNPFRGKELEGKKVLGEFDFWISNLSMKRSFFLQHGFFFEFPGPAFEDLELSYRLFKKGLRLIYCSDALTYHYHPQTIDTVIHRVYETGKNFPVYEKLVPHNNAHKEAKLLSRRLGLQGFLHVLFRDIFRTSLFNRLTIPHVVVPLIHEAETRKFLEPFVGFLEKRVSGYYFRKGVADGRKVNR